MFKTGKGKKPEHHFNIVILARVKTADNNKNKVFPQFSFVLCFVFQPFENWHFPVKELGHILNLSGYATECT